MIVTTFLSVGLKILTNSAVACHPDDSLVMLWPQQCVCHGIKDAFWHAAWL